MNPKELAIADYTYTLPEAQIAFHPLEERDASKLLVAHQPQYTLSQYANIASFLPEKSLIVFNNTRVVAARLLFQKPTGATIEVFCIEPGEKYPDVGKAMLEKGFVEWHCMIGGAAKWKKEQDLELQITTPDGDYQLRAHYIEKHHDLFKIQLSWSPADLSFSEILQKTGRMPLPPYIKRAAAINDRERYQTVYAKEEGSVAAPTAGLHFTDRVLHSLEEKKIRTSFVTLHVGAGTFQPVKAATLGDHPMHSEFIEIDRNWIEQYLNDPVTITAVGTTSLRTLESMYWLGVKAHLNPTIAPSGMPITQWEVYQHANETMRYAAALKALALWMDQQQIQRFITTTQILIAPGYQFRAVDRLVTNFHQPQSTLLLLIAAFMGEEWKNMYRYALDNDFRFLSYGDGCLLYRKDSIL